MTKYHIFQYLIKKYLKLSLAKPALKRYTCNQSDALIPGCEMLVCFMRYCNL